VHIQTDYLGSSKIRDYAASAPASGASGRRGSASSSSTTTGPSPPTKRKGKKKKRQGSSRLSNGQNATEAAAAATDGDDGSGNELAAGFPSAGDIGSRVVVEAFGEGVLLFYGETHFGRGYVAQIHLISALFWCACHLCAVLVCLPSLLSFIRVHTLPP
jgi:hypothetical protein